MLLFSTILPIKDTLTKEAFIRTAIEWNQGMGRRERITFPEFDWNEETLVRFGDENVWLQVDNCCTENVSAVQYHNTDGYGIVWDARFVINCTTHRLFARLDRAFPDGKAEKRMRTQFSSPRLIQMLIERGYIDADSDIPVSWEPVMITADNLDMIANVINGNSDHILPVVYISCPFSGERVIDADDAAKRLKGAAHVLVERDPGASTRLLREQTDGRNAYNGAATIYFPDGSQRRLRVCSTEEEGRSARNAIVKYVLEYNREHHIERLRQWSEYSAESAAEIYAEQEAPAEPAIVMRSFVPDVKTNCNILPERNVAQGNLRSIPDAEANCTKDANDRLGEGGNSLLDKLRRLFLR